MRGSAEIRVLVVDDEVDNATIFKSVLEREGMLVTALTDPLLAMPALRETDFQLVIIDMMMPQMSGTELLKQIREMDDDLAVIVATGFPKIETAVASLQLAASDYIKKPIDPEQFLKTVRATLEKKGITRDVEGELHQTIGRVIREGRTRQKLTLKQLARRTGLSVSLLSQIERAESSASISSLYRIATALRVRMSSLFLDV